MEVPLAIPAPSGLSITISEATSEDLPAIAKITVASQLPEAMMAFIWHNWPSTEYMLPSYLARTIMKHEDPMSTLLKAVDEETGEIVGTVAVTHENVEGAEPRPAIKPGFISDGMEGMNVAFVTMVSTIIAEFDEVMVGREHYLLSAFAVDPKFQGRGIGTKMMLACQKIAAEKRIPIYLQAYPGAHGVYLRLGFVEKIFKDVDLNEWGAKRRGFGVYRGRGMLWEPEKAI